MSQTLQPGMAAEKVHHRCVIGDVEDAEGFWGPSQEASLHTVLEAMHRFEQVTQDGRSAAALTLAWAMLESGYLGKPE